VDPWPLQFSQNMQTRALRPGRVTRSRRGILQVFSVPLQAPVTFRAVLATSRHGWGKLIVAEGHYRVHSHHRWGGLESGLC
jgi:hypothetical protein